MEVSRRSFLGGALALTAVSAVPAKAIAALGPVPVIYGDGAHDDTAGLQAALDGKPFRVFGDRVYVVRREGEIYLTGGNYILSDTLHFRGPVKATIEGFRARFVRASAGAPLILFSSEGHVLRNAHLEGPRVPKALRDDPRHQHVGILVAT